MSPPSQSKSIQLRIDSVRPIPVVSITFRCALISALPCPVSCAQRSAMSHRVASCPIVALPCRSISDRFLSTPSLSAAPPLASDHISAVASRSRSILWLLGSTRGFALPFIRISMRLDSRPIAASPSPWWSVPICTIPQLLPFAPFFALPLHIPSILFVSLAVPVNSMPGHLSSCRIVWPRRHSTAIRIVPRPFAAFSIRLITSLIFSISQRLISMPFRFISFAVVAMPLPFRSKPFPAVQCLRQSFRVAAMPSPVSSSQSAPFMAIPLLVASVRFGSRLCRFRSISSSLRFAVSKHLRYSQRRAVSSLLHSPLSKADQIRCRSYPGASGCAQRCRIASVLFIPRLLYVLASRCLLRLGYSFSVRMFTPPLASLPFQLVSARFRSCPSLAVSPPCQSWRIGPPHRRLISCLLGSMPCPVRSGFVPASQSLVHSTQTKPG